MAEQNDLDTKVKEWLKKQGYPLEFEVAAKFRDYGFVPHRGRYVNDPKTGAAREIDIVADANFQIERPLPVLLRLSIVTECKWSGDKPWVIFTSEARIAPSAAVAQAISRWLGEALLHWAAGDKELQKLHPFSHQGRTGFDGTRALGDKNDACYAALQAVTTKAVLSSDKYVPRREPGTLAFPDMAQVSFPLIVLDGPLYECFYDEKSKTTELASIELARLHWDGAEIWPRFTVVDIVTRKGLDMYLAKWEAAAQALPGLLVPALENIHEFYEKRDKSVLKPTRGSRGIIGPPALIATWLEAFENARKAIKPVEEER